MISNKDLDSLFMLPLAEFTSARNELVKRLKKANRDEEADEVKAISKPSVSAWATNQLYWHHRGEFKRLLDAGKQLAQAQAAQLTGGTGDLRARMATRREAISALLQLAEALLRDAGHGATPDTLRRIETTLETLSTSSAIPGAPEPGHLTEDVAPLGFESLAALMPGGVVSIRREKVDLAAKKLKDAKALVSAKENELRQAEETLERSRAAVEEAVRRAHALHAEAEKAEKRVHDAEAALKKARADLERLR